MSDPQVIASVILDDAINAPLDYEVKDALKPVAKEGCRVLVPVKNTLRKGTILSFKNTSDFKNLKEIAEVLSEKPIVSSDLFLLAAWMSRYYCAPMRKVLQSILPPSIRGNAKPKTQLFIKALLSAVEVSTECQALRKTHPTQAEVLDVLLQHPRGILLSELLEKAKISRSPIESLAKKKIISCEPLCIDRSILEDQEYFPSQPKKLNPDQAAALSPIIKSIDEKRFETHLIYGVTGSGKTEVYFQAMQHALSVGKGVILLVPEITLTSQTLERLKSRFSEKIAILHHRLSDGQRYDAWHHIREGTAPIVVGARSAIFSPVPNLGLIIVDEEHESSYKQSEDFPSYHARDVAVMRGKFSHATVVLGSATPALESYHNAALGKYRLSSLSTRADKANMPKVALVDMRKEYEKHKGYTLFSDSLISALKQRISSGEQSILFLNRRGYHTSQLCLKCSEVSKCPHCDVSLTYHQKENALSCHLCDHRLCPPPKNCTHCGSEASMKYKGAGTEQVEKALHAIFPSVRSLRLDADTTRHKGSHETLLRQFRAGKADVLIGTQMIAKGLHFEAVTLVGILNADANLSIPDFRSTEHSFQLITQVSGRSGRGELAGEVIIQTFMPESEMIQMAAHQDFDIFYQKEISNRKFFEYPPFTHFVKVCFSGPSQEKTLQSAEAMRNLLIKKLPPSFQLHPVVASGHAKVKDRHRFQFLIRGEKITAMTALMNQIVKEISFDKDIRMFIDVDPLSTFF